MVKHIIGNVTAIGLTAIGGFVLIQYLIKFQPSRKNRCYSPTSMMKAIAKVRRDSAHIRPTAREFGVPEASLRHKLSGRVDPNATRSGPPPMFTAQEEAQFVDYIKFMTSCGYGYSRTEVADMASEYAIHLGKRDKGHSLTFRWYRGFKSRWPEVKILPSGGLAIQRAKATSRDCLTKYYTELGSILTMYGFENKPERIYHVEEKGLPTAYTPSKVVSSVNAKPESDTAASRTTVTVIGCGTAMGKCVPPYFVFPGDTMRQEWLEGKSTGADGSVSESGSSNSVIFRRYLETHLMKYLPARSPDNPVLVVYDGHRSHINLGLINWAKKEQSIILFILPAHTSYVFQPEDAGCFESFDRIFKRVSNELMGDKQGQSITSDKICSLGCLAYAEAFSSDRLQASFRKIGIYPFDPNVVDSSNLKSSDAQ